MPERHVLVIRRYSVVHISVYTHLLDWRVFQDSKRSEDKVAENFIVGVVGRLRLQTIGCDL